MDTKAIGKVQEILFFNRFVNTLNAKIIGHEIEEDFRKQKASRTVCNDGIILYHLM